MMKWQVLLSVLLGVGVGWFARGAFDHGPLGAGIHDEFSKRATEQSGANLPPRAVSPFVSSGKPSADGGTTRVATNSDNQATIPSQTTIHNQATIPAVSGGLERSLGDQFRALLGQFDYVGAMSFYARHRAYSESELRPMLLSHLEALMDAGQANDFTELTDQYLSYYYDDIDVLLLLAKFNQRSDYYSESISFFQLADEYAYNFANKTKVAEAFAEFLQQTDAYLVSINDWYSLNQVFLQAELVGLLSPEQRLRQVEVLLNTGDDYHGREILAELVTQSSVSDRARAMLAALSGQSEQAVALPTPSPYRSAVALQRSGNQYLLNLGLGQGLLTTLLIDTGASMTTLSRGAFERLEGDIDAMQVGVRMFSTANGVTKGDIYQVDRVTLGDYEMEDVLIAVLNFNMSPGIDGLLGMNVLGKFRFQIEQDQQELLLSPR